MTLHTFSMHDLGMQTCLQHENMLVPVQNHWEWTYVHIFDRTVFGGGSGGLESNMLKVLPKMLSGISEKFHLLCT